MCTFNYGSSHLVSEIGDWLSTAAKMQQVYYDYDLKFTPVHDGESVGLGQVGLVRMHHSTAGYFNINRL